MFSPSYISDIRYSAVICWERERFSSLSFYNKAQISIYLFQNLSIKQAEVKGGVFEVKGGVLSIELLFVAYSI